MKERLWIVAPRVGGGGFLRAPSMRAAIWEANQRGWRVYREGWDADDDRTWALEPGAMTERLQPTGSAFELRLDLLVGYDRATEPAAEPIGIVATPARPRPTPPAPPAAPIPAPSPPTPRAAEPTRGAQPPPSTAQRGLFG
jgi:hypothetical protein